MKPANALKGNPPKQQTIERHYFEMFRKAYPLPPGEITYADKPRFELRSHHSVNLVRLAAIPVGSDSSLGSGA